MAYIEIIYKYDITITTHSCVSPAIRRRDYRQERGVRFDEMRELITDQIDECSSYITIHVSYASGDGLSIEDVRIVENALFFIVFGCEDAFRDVTGSEPIPFRQLTDVIEWVQRDMRTTAAIRERIQRLQTFLQTAGGKKYP